MIDWIVRQYYKIPHVQLRNPFIVSKRDSREFDWFKCRQKHGFDERSLWHIGNTINYKVKDVFDDAVPGEWCTLEQFTVWFKNNPVEVEWMHKRLKAYKEWDCPTFYQDRDYMPLPDDVQTGIMDRLVHQTSVEGHADDRDIEFIYDHIFQLGW